MLTALFQRLRRRLAHPLAPIAAALFLALAIPLAAYAAQAVSGSVVLRVTMHVAQTVGLASADAPAIAAVEQDFTDGAGANKAHQLWSSSARSIAASGTEDLDLSGSLTDAFGNSITFTKIKGFYVKAAAANTNDVVLGNAASHAWAALLGATGTLTLKPGGILLVTAPAAAGMAVSGGSTDDLLVTNSSSGTAVVYDILIWGE